VPAVVGLGADVPERVKALLGGGNVRRSERLIQIAKRLVDHPNHVVSLGDLTVDAEVAKSTVSEDVALVRSVLEATQEGTIETIAGAGGGVKYCVALPTDARLRFLSEMCNVLTDPSRILPGGFIYMSDVLGNSDVLDRAGRLFAQEFADAGANVVVTIETKGIPLAVATAHYLNVPVVIVRREHKVTEGAQVSVHYVSGSAGRIQTMSISKRAMPQNARALIVDDFMRAGATAKAVVHLLAEFSAEVVGTAVFMATMEPQQKLVRFYTSLLTLGNVEEGHPVMVRPSDAAVTSLPERRFNMID